MRYARFLAIHIAYHTVLHFANQLEKDADTVAAVAAARSKT